VSVVRRVRAWSSVAGAVARRPALWATAVRVAGALAPPRWWTRRPWLPVPDAAYLRFRTVTQYGDAERLFERGDVVEYLSWYRSWNRALR
jgi:hypothetical protein